MKIIYNVNDKATGVIVGQYTNREKAREHKAKSDNYFIAVKWVD